MSRQQLAPALLALGAAPLAGVLVVHWSEKVDAFAVLAAVSGLLVAAIVHTSFPRPRSQHWFSPVGLFVGYLLTAICLVPLLWQLELATPWPEVVERRLPAVAVASLLLVCLAIGVATGRGNRTVSPIALSTEQHVLSSILVLCLTAGILSIVSVAYAVGGFGVLITSLGVRRDLLAGTGPLQAGLAVTAVGTIYGVMHSKRSRANSRLTLACGVAYFSGSLAIGSRFQALIVLLAVFAALARSGRPVVRYVLPTVAAVIPASVAYVYQVRQQLSFGRSQGRINTESPREFVKSTIDPFVEGGLDSLRTTAVATRDAPTLEINLAPFLDGFGNLVPRLLWPSKPEGTDVYFSRRFFPAQWEGGTGIPPSAPAETTVLFGLVGAALAIAVVGFLLARLTHKLAASRSLYAVLLWPVLTADIVLLAKSGTHSFLRTFAMHALALLVVGGLGVLNKTHVIEMGEPVPNDGATPPKGAPLAGRRVAVSRLAPGRLT